jgi:transcriptional regulator with XRE-family HTH domain
MHPDMRRIGARVRELRKSLKLNQARFAKLIGVDQSTVSKWENNAQTPEGEALLALAKLAKKTVEEFLGDTELKPMRVEDVLVIGKVQAGEWMEVWEYPPEDQFEISVPPSRKYRGYKRFGLEVVGPSMNLVYAEGTFILCARLDDLGRSPVDGERVIVERMRADGRVEVTVKEWQTDPKTGTVWLWPRSSDPEYTQPYRLPKPEDGNGIEAIRVTAIVTGRYSDE